MLIQLSITNFRSIKDKVTISMLPIRYKDHLENIFEVNTDLSLLKSAVIYGANASGKSNLLRAFKALQYIVKESSGFKLEDKR